MKIKSDYLHFITCGTFIWIINSWSAEDVSVFFRCTAMDDQQIDLSHNDCVLNKSVLVDWCFDKNAFKYSNHFKTDSTKKETIS